MTGFSWRSASWGQPTSLWFSVPTKGWSGLSNQLKSTPPLSKVVPKVLGEWPYRHGFFEGDGDDVKDYSCLHWVPSESLHSPVVTGRKHPWSIPHFQISLVFNSSMLFWKAALGRHNFLETKRNVKRPHFEFGLEDTLILWGVLSLQKLWGALLLPDMSCLPVLPRGAECLPVLCNQTFPRTWRTWSWRLSPNHQVLTIVSLKCLRLFIYPVHTSLGQLPGETSLSSHCISQQSKWGLKTVMGSVALATAIKPSLGFPLLPELPAHLVNPPGSSSPSLRLIYVSGPFVVVGSKHAGILCIHGLHLRPSHSLDNSSATFLCNSWLFLCSRLTVCVPFPEAFPNKLT